MKQIFGMMAPLIMGAASDAPLPYVRQPGEGHKRAQKRLAEHRTLWANTPVKPVEGTRAYKRRNARTVAKSLGVPMTNVWRSIQTGEEVKGLSA